jgi:hypothetical protein
MPLHDLHHKQRNKNVLLLVILSILILGLYWLSMAKFGG